MHRRQFVAGLLASSSMGVIPKIIPEAISSTIPDSNKLVGALDTLQPGEEIRQAVINYFDRLKLNYGVTCDETNNLLEDLNQNRINLTVDFFLNEKEGYNNDKPCTCYPGEAPVPCQYRYSHSECMNSLAKKLQRFITPFDWDMSNFEFKVMSGQIKDV